jgi:outer membrane protein OmpA-like peptidoglycan-associated protein
VFSVGSDATVVHVLSGIAEVYNPAFPDQRVLVGADNRTTVPRNGPPSDPKRARRETVREYREIIESIHERIVVEISYAIHFAPNTAEILPRSRSELERVRQRIRHVRGDIVIVGHTARVGDRSAMYELSVERAEAVRTYLINTGIRSSRLSVVGYGAERPVATNETREGRARNRRVEFVIRR